ncbi:down syndrome cell adhesion molecule [Caerostris extrusa]|uniref:Down syndrome cell adhesion molecule n=1 Tax=Caerostris extrusa TaxID=172846 RepID=A0AAV4Y3I2_CAEEX|nr:down syndrome cell adhesion molecule [Caerostris extrusa]
MKRGYTIDETMTDEGITSEVHIQSADREILLSFTCIAENSFGKDEMNIQIIVQEKPDKPFKLTAHESTSRTISLTWSPPYSGNSPISLYTIQYKPSSVPGGPPLAVQADAPPAPNLQNGPLAGYYVGYKIHGSSKPYTYKTLEITDAFRNECLITNLKRVTTYSVIVQAFNRRGAGPPSDEIKVKTKDNDPPTNPILNIMTTTHTTIQVQWEVRSSSSSPIEGFHLHYKRELGGWQEIQVPSNKRDHTFESLQCGTRYHFYMTAFNEVGEGLPSDAVTAKTLGVGSSNRTQPELVLAVQCNPRCAVSQQMERRWLRYHLLRHPVQGWKRERTGPCVRSRAHAGGALRTGWTEPGTWYRLHIMARNDAGPTQAEYSFSTSVLNDGANPLPPVIKRPAPFYTSLAIVAPVVVTVIILISVLIVVCALSRRRRNGDRQYEDSQSVRKEMNPEAVQMSEYEVKQDGTYVQAKDSSLYFSFPYATSRVPVFSLDERSSGESSTDGRSTLHDIERPYDVPFAVKQIALQVAITNPQALIERNPCPVAVGLQTSTTSTFGEQRLGPRSTAISSNRWQCGTKQGAPYAKTCGDGYEDDECGSPFHLSGARELAESSDAECDRDQILYVHTDAGKKKNL